MNFAQAFDCSSWLLIVAFVWYLFSPWFRGYLKEVKEAISLFVVWLRSKKGIEGRKFGPQIKFSQVGRRFNHPFYGPS